MMAEDLDMGGYSGGVASELVDVEDATSNDNTNDDGPRGEIGKDDNATKTFFDREIRDGYDLTWSGINVSLVSRYRRHRSFASLGALYDGTVIYTVQWGPT